MSAFWFCIYKERIKVIFPGVKDIIIESLVVPNNARYLEEIIQARLSFACPAILLWLVFQELPFSFVAGYR